jgi:hypothetical protein
MQIDAIKAAGDTGKAVIVIGSFFLPGPEDAVWAAVGSKYGIKVVTEKGGKFVLQRFEKILKSGSKEFDEAYNLVRLGKIGNSLEKYQNAKKIKNIADRVSKQREALAPIWDIIRNDMSKEAKEAKKYIIYGKPSGGTEVQHFHFKGLDERYALNLDGTWKHNPPKNWAMPRTVEKYLNSLGIKIQPW